MTTPQPSGAPGRTRRGWPWAALALAFMSVPVLEIFLIVQLGQALGAWWTLLLLVASGVRGAYLVRREGRRAWQALREAIGSGRMPARELADAALVLVGGTLLITPGFVTDAVGALLVLPLTRPLARAALSRVLARRLTVAQVHVQHPGHHQSRHQTQSKHLDVPRPPSPRETEVVQGEVVEGDEPPPGRA